MAWTLSVTEAVSTKKEILKLIGAWADAFGEPGWIDVWFIWGNSGNGKGSFVMQFCKELAKFGWVAYDSLEEGVSLTIQNMLRCFNVVEANRHSQLLNRESMFELGERMDKYKGPDFCVINSFQYTQMSYEGYIKFKEAHRNKLLIFISHADGRNPDGRNAKKVMYDVALRIYVERFRAFSKSRFFGFVGHLTIWDEGVVRYWGDNA